MTSRNGTGRPAPRIESLHVQNYRVLRNVHLADLKPLTVLIGPNGSGKSTIFDVFAFLSECFSDGLQRAWTRRGGMREIRSRGSAGPVEIELKYREMPKLKKSPVITYHLAIDEDQGLPVIAREWLQWRRGSHGKPFRFLDYQHGTGTAVAGDQPDSDAERTEQPLDSPDLLAVSALGQLQAHPRVSALRRFITGWYLSFLDLPNLRDKRNAGPEPRLSKSGENLANVLQFLQQSDPGRLEAIFSELARRVPQLERVNAEVLRDGTVLLELKDQQFDEPILSRYISDGTIKLLAYLILLGDPAPPPLIGIEEPENFVHPALLRELGEEYLETTVRSQLLVTTHAPSLLDSLDADQVRVLSRGPDGFTKTRVASDIAGILDHLNTGGLLGIAWQQNMFSRPSIPSHAR